MNASHPGDELLVAFALEELEASEATRVSSHLESCRSCRKAVTGLARALAVARRGATPDAPLDVLTDLLDAQARSSDARALTGRRSAPRTPRGRPRFWPRLVPALATTVLLFAVGFWFGRRSAVVGEGEPIFPGLGPTSERVVNPLPEAPAMRFVAAVPLDGSLSATLEWPRDSL